MNKKITKRHIFCGAVILAIIIVPFLYSYFYLGAFWDPYSKLESLPVAVVNSDKGSKIDGKQRNLGEEMCDRLKDDGSLKFIFTNAKDAKAGTEGTDYYATITIPEDFSENIASASTDDKQTAKIIYSPNEKRNYLASQILNRAVLEVEEETRSNVDKEIVQQLSDKIKEVPDKLSELQDGLGKLGDGSSKLVDGIDKLKDGSGKLSDGTTTLSEGTLTLLEGSGTLSSGTGKLLKGTGTLKTGTGKLLNGTDTLLAGTKSLKEGTSTYYSKFKEYKAGVTTVKTGSAALATGAGTLQTGIDQLKGGSDLLVEKTKNIGQITSGAKTVADGTKAFDTSLNQYTSGVSSLITSVTNTSTAIGQVVKANPALLKDPTIAALVKQLSDPAASQNLQNLQSASALITAASSKLVVGTQQLYDGTTGLSDLNTALLTLSAGATKLQTGSVDLTNGAKKLDAGVTSLNTATDKLYSAAGDIKNGAAKLNSGAKSLNSGASDLNSGASDLNSGASDLNSGASKLYSGVKKLNNGATDLNTGAKSLNKGVNKLENGAVKLDDGIGEAKSGVDKSVNEANDQVGALDGLADFASAPVSIDQKSVTSIENYGTAFAPYFMSLSLWVGALILFVGIYLDTEGKFKILSRESNHRLGRSFGFLIIGFAQAIALAVVVIAGLGLKVDNVLLFYTSVCLVSMVFISIVQFLIVHFKSVGKLLSIVLLILQLTSCGGTFPMETVPKIFNVLFPYMPMTYSVALFKQAITDTDTSAVLYNGGILFAILVVFMALTIILSSIKARRAVKTEVQMPALEN